MNVGMLGEMNRACIGYFQQFLVILRIQIAGQFDPPLYPVDMAMTGHTDIKSVERYVQEAERKVLAENAIRKLKKDLKKKEKQAKKDRLKSGNCKTVCKINGPGTNGGFLRC